MKNEIKVEYVYSRLRRAGVDIKSQKAVVEALESEIRHYRSVIEEMRKRADLHLPEKSRMVYDWESCRACELSRMMHEINTYGYKLIAVTQHMEVYTVFFERCSDA